MNAKKSKTPHPGSNETGSNLRQQAEAALRNAPEGNENSTSPPQDWRDLLHELRVHQIELEMQNDELRQAQGESESARDRYIDLYDFAPVGYLTLRHPGIILAANLTATMMLGVPRSQLIGSTLAHFVFAEDQDAYYHYLKALFRSEARGSIEVRLIKSDATQFDARLEASTWDRENLIQLVLSDVTDLKRAEQALMEMNATLEQRVAERTAELRESEHRYAAIFEKSPIAFALTRMPESVTVSVNDAFLKLFEYSREEVIGKTSVDLGIADADTRAQVAAQFQAQGSVRDFECTCTTKSGAQRELSLNLDWVSIGGEKNVLTTIRDITERKRSEERISYQAWLLDNINDAIVASDEQYRLTAWNAAAEALYGWRADEVLSQKGIELLRTDFVGSDPEEMRRHIMDVGRWRGETTQLRKDGVRIPVEVASIVLRDANGQIKGYVSVNRDITERKQAEDKLRKAYNELEQRVQERTHELIVANEELKGEIAERERAESQLRLLSVALEAAANGIFITGRRGNIRWANPAFTQMTGYAQDEILGQNPRFLKSGKHEPEFYQQMWETILSGEVWHGDMINRRKDGSLYYEEQTITPLLDENGEIASFIAIKQDVSERRKAEQAVRESEALLRKVLDTMPVGVWLIDQNGMVTQTNSAGRQIWAGVRYVGIEGYGEYKGWWLDSGELIRPEDWAAARALRRGETSLNEEIEIECFDGTHKIVLNSAVPILDANGAILGAIVVEQDITERKHVEEMILRERQRLRNILDTMQDGVYIVNKDYAIEYINPVIERDFGPVDSRKCHEYFHGLATPCEWCKNDEVFAGKSLNWEWYSDKTNKTYDLFDTLMVNPEGKISKLEIFHDITDRKKAEALLERNVEELRSLSEAESKQRELAESLVQTTISMNASLQPDEILANLLENIRYAVPYQAANISIISGNTLRVATHRGYEKNLDGPAAMQQDYNIDDFPLLQRVHTSLQPVCIEDTQMSDEWKVIRGLEWVRSYIAAPMIIEGQVTGIINLNSDQPGFYNQEMIARLMAFTAPAALALHNGQLFKAELKARQTAEILSAVAQALAQTLDLDQVINTLLDHLGAIIPVDLVAVALMESENRLGMRVLRGFDQLADDNLSSIMHLGIDDFPAVQELISNRRCIVIPESDQYAYREDTAWIRVFHSWLLAPIVAGDKVIGLVGMGKREAGHFTPEHQGWVEALIGQAAVAMQNAWLFEQVRISSERLQFLSRRLVEVQENELRLVAQELHDEVGQALTSIILGLQLIEKSAENPQAIRTEVAKLSRVLDNVMEDLHRLAMDLRPASLDHLGLEAALHQHIEAIREKSDLVIQFGMIGVEERLPANMEIALYRIIQEALTNIVRHAHATRADVLIQRRADKLILIIEDNGQGFQAAEAMRGERLGLFGMRERAEMMGGELVIESAGGKGTTILVEVPYADSDSHRR